MAVDVLIRERCERLVIHYDHVSRSAFLQYAQRLLEVLGGDLSVVLEEHRNVFAPCHVRHSRVVSLDYQEYLEALEHVVCVSVCTHADCDALCHHLQHRRAAYGIAHVRLRVVDYHGACFLDDIHLGRTYMYAVSEQGLLAEYPVVQEPVDRSASVIPEAVVYIVHALCHMDVESGHAVVRFDHLLECLVGDGEESVAAEHGLDHVVILFDRPFCEICVLLDALQGLLLAVSLGDFIAEARSHSELLSDVLDCKERSRYLAEACVMVEYGRYTVSDAVQYGRICAGLCSVDSQMTVDGPPCAVEDLKEVCRVVSDDRKSSCKSGVNMCMSVDQTRHDYAALSVDEFGVRICCFHIGERSDRLYHLSVDNYGSVFQVRKFRISRNKLSVSY